MAGGVLSSVIQAIDKLAAHIRQLSGSSSLEPCSVEDLDKLKKTLLRIQDSVQDSEREIGDASTKVWLSELEVSAYDIENILMESQFLGYGAEQRTRMDAPSKRKRDQVCNSVKAPLPDDVAHKIMEIRRRVDEAATEWAAIHLTQSDGRRWLESTGGHLLSGFQIDESFVYGREDDKENVIKLVLSDDCKRDEVSVIPIVGMAGVGKTTLAQLVYNDSRICEHFTTRGWVHVSQNFDVTRLTRAILESITGKPCDSNELIELQGTLMEVLSGKRLLLVLDDVWNEKESTWACLMSPFSSAEMSKVVVTTRFVKVAKIMQTVVPYQLHNLTEDKCWQLFHRFAFDGQDPNEHPNLIEIGKKIAAKCHGWPLAAKTLGGQLRFETDEESWKDILEGDLSELVGENQ
ncbi:putative disease resistance protein RGA3 [Phoenix dactylifera]|uniref:Disease resistance protein RGA3 n=1 Tax=Phoenix dactylifera TaxID=42345 RepID=A0A8B7CSI7_PHODC|nr:putative disease resistance protein RGA3 [Phoenix dactylifera]